MDFKISIIPLFTSVISYVFAVLLLKQFIRRQKIQQLLWTIAIFFYGTSSLMELLMNPNLFGFNVILFTIFYVGASSLVGLLGAGQLYLIVKHKISHIFLLFVVMLSIILALALSLNSFPTSLSFTGELGEDIRIISNGYPLSVRIYAIILASVGGSVLLIGSLYSFIRDRTRYYALLFVIGAIIPMLRNVPFGYLGNELAGIISLFIGFILSIIYLKKQSVQISQ